MRSREEQRIQVRKYTRPVNETFKDEMNPSQNGPNLILEGLILSKLSLNLCLPPLCWTRLSLALVLTEEGGDGLRKTNRG